MPFFISVNDNCDMTHKYSVLKALRPFSFSVALITCVVGIVGAATLMEIDPWLALAVVLGAVLLQAGVNLINDYSDLQWQQDSRCRTMIRRNFRLGLSCFFLAAACGVVLVAARGLPLLLLFLLGLVGALGYTLEPINFKRRGLAVALVFWLMGMLMVCGSYYAVTGSVSWLIFYQAIPVSLISSLLLLANELRDHQVDEQQGVRTLTVRIGFKPAMGLYKILLLAVFLISVVLWWQEGLSAAWWLLSLPMLWLIGRLLSSEQSLRNNLPPMTGRFFMLFGLLYVFSL